MERFGRYHIERRLDAGPKREAYLANLGDGAERMRMLAICDLADADRAPLFEDMARCRGLQQRAMVACDAPEQDGGRVGIAVPRIAGMTLNQLRRAAEEVGTPITDVSALEVAACVMLTMAHAHNAGGARKKPLLHGALSPHHVWITWDGHVRIVGVGLATVHRAAVRQKALPADVLAHLRVEAPRRYEPSVVGDVYSAAMIVWCLLTDNDAPLDADDMEPLSALRPDLPPGVLDIIDGALGLKPSVVAITAARAAAVLRDAAGDEGAAELAWLADSLKGQVRDSLICVEVLPPKRLDVGRRRLDTLSGHVSPKKRSSLLGKPRARQATEVGIPPPPRTREFPPPPPGRAIPRPRAPLPSSNGIENAIDEILADSVPAKPSRPVTVSDRPASDPPLTDRPTSAVAAQTTPAADEMLLEDEGPLSIDARRPSWHSIEVDLATLEQEVAEAEKRAIAERLRKEAEELARAEREASLLVPPRPASKQPPPPPREDDSAPEIAVAAVPPAEAKETEPELGLVRESDFAVVPEFRAPSPPPPPTVLESNRQGSTRSGSLWASAGLTTLAAFVGGFFLHAYVIPSQSETPAAQLAQAAAPADDGSCEGPAPAANDTPTATAKSSGGPGANASRSDTDPEKSGVAASGAADDADGEADHDADASDDRDDAAVLAAVADVGEPPPPGHAWLVVEGPGQGHHVYLSGRPIGKVGERLAVPCGSAAFLRVGTVPLQRWFSPGYSVTVECDVVNTVDLADAARTSQYSLARGPGATTSASDDSGDRYEPGGL